MDLLNTTTVETEGFVPHERGHNSQKSSDLGEQTEKERRRRRTFFDFRTSTFSIKIVHDKEEVCSPTPTTFPFGSTSALPILHE